MSVRRFGRYELLTELGRGGMAELHLARLPGIGGFEKLVAIKRMLPHLSENKQFSDMFLNEGRIAARLSHPNICQVFEIGEEAGRLFLALEYLEGITWDELVRALPDDPRERLRTITGVLAQACDGLHYAHELRDSHGVASPVIHRDVSPQNLFVTVAGVCKVLDFGVAKMKSDVTHTKTGVLKGKIPYMSPQQLRGEDIDHRSDVFAVGVLLWEAVTGKHLFVRDGEFQMWKAVLEDEIRPPSALRPGYDQAIDEIVMRALERDVERRYATIQQLAAALRALGERLGGSLPAAQVGALVLAQCSDTLLVRKVELAAIDRPAIAPDTSFRDAPTISDAAVGGSVVLRAEAVRVREPRRRQPRRLRRQSALGLAASAIAVVAIVLVLVLGGSSEDVPASALDEPAKRSTLALAPKQRTTEPTSATDTPRSENPTSATTEHTDEVPTSEPLHAKAPIEKPRLASKTGTVRQRPPRPPTLPDDPPVTAQQPGTLSIGTEPTARLYIDGRFIEETPTYRYKLGAGRHELRLVPADGTPYQRTIKIEPGKELNLGTVRL